MTHFTLRGHELSPVKHLYLKGVALDRPQKVEVLDKFVDKVSETGAIRVCWYDYYVYTFMSHPDIYLSFTFSLYYRRFEIVGSKIAIDILAIDIGCYQVNLLFVFPFYTFFTVH